MSKNEEFDPFSNNLINENNEEDLISEDEINEIILESDKQELSQDLEFDEIFSFKSIKARKSNQKSFIDSEDIESDSEITELRSKEDKSGKSKAEVLINRRNNGELESIEVIASNGERILINFEYDDKLENESESTETNTTDDIEKDSTEKLKAEKTNLEENSGNLLNEEESIGEESEISSEDENQETEEKKRTSEEEE